MCFPEDPDSRHKVRKYEKAGRFKILRELRDKLFDFFLICSLRSTGLQYIRNLVAT